MRLRTASVWTLGCGAMLLGAVLCAAPARGEISTVIVLEDIALPCKVVKHDEKSLTVLLTETGAVVTLDWDKLSAAERRRLQGLVRVEDAPTGIPLGKQIDGVEVTLNNSMCYRGKELVDRQTTSHKYFRCRGTPLIGFPIKDIKSIKPIKIYEGELYSPQERYRTRLATEPPQTSEQYFQTGIWCLDNELPQEADDNFAKAVLLDPGYEEKCKARKDQLAALARKLQARELYKQIMVNKARGAYTQVIKDIDVLLAQYPDFEENTKLTLERPLLDKMRTQQVRREVISLWYMYMDHHIQRIAYSRLSETPAVPVKVVYLNSGNTLEGNIKGSEDAAEVMLDIGGRTFSIDRKLIARIEQKMIEKGPWRERTLAECKKYVTDAKGGIGADILKDVTKALGITDKEAQETWDKRLSDVIVVGEAGLKEPEVVASFQDAHWSVGSWLRGGGAGGAGGAAGGAAGAVAPGLNPGGTRGGTARGGNPRGGAGGAGGAQGQPQWKDPEEWWKEQAPNIKAEILKAMCAEESGIFKVEKSYEENCINCGGTGQIEVMSMGSGGGGKYGYPCSVCRGSGRFYGVSYR